MLCKIDGSRVSFMDESEVRAQVRARVREMGGVNAARALGMPQRTVLAIAADARVHVGSLVRAQVALDRLAGEAGAQ